MKLRNALATVLDMADEQQATDKENSKHFMAPQYNLKAQAQAIKAVSRLYKLMEPEEVIWSRKNS